MSYGLNLYNEAGTVIFSTDWSAWNYIDSYVVPAGTTISRSYPVLATLTESIAQRSFLNVPPNNQEAYICSVSRSGTTITATGGNVTCFVVLLAR